MTDDEYRDIPPNRKLEKAPTTFTEMSNRYNNSFPLRAAIQAIPGVGSTIDTLLGGLGAKYQYERFEDFLKQLDDRTRNLQLKGIPFKLEETEQAYDFIISVFDHVRRTRSRNKRRYFANLLTRQFVEHLEWDEAESAMRLLEGLTDVHIHVLQAAVMIDPIEEGPFKGHQIISLPEKLTSASFTPQNELIDLFPRLGQAYLRMICSELIAKGLLHDKGIEGTNIGAMEYLIPTSSANWLINWLSEYTIDQCTTETHPPVICDFNTPPESAKPGERFGILDNPTGDWVAHPNGIAEWDGKRWLFTDPEEGMIVYNEEEGKAFRFKAGEWIDL